MGWATGVEPATPRSTILCSNQLSYAHLGKAIKGIVKRSKKAYTPYCLGRIRSAYTITKNEKAKREEDGMSPSKTSRKVAKPLASLKNKPALKKTVASKLNLKTAATKKTGPKVTKAPSPSAAASRKALPPNRARKAALSKPNASPQSSGNPGYTQASAGEIPFSYNETKLVLIARDTEWAFTYWDFSSQTWAWIQDFKARDSRVKTVLRLRNVDQASFCDLEIQLEARNWYLHLGLPNTTFEAELGLLDSSGKFHLIARSNRIRTPRNGPADVIDPAWNPGAAFDEIYKLSGGGKTGHGSEIFSQFKRP